MVHIAVFASGGGSNAARIIAHFSGHAHTKVALVVTNKPQAGVIHIAERAAIPVHCITRTSFYQTDELLRILRKHDIAFIALAGFLWLVPTYILQAFPKKIVNIHPSLLPRYGGKGMYGHHVHEAVWAAREGHSGMTIHYATAEYDEGAIIYQGSCAVHDAADAAAVGQRVLALEHLYYPIVIESLCKSLS